MAGTTKDIAMLKTKVAFGPVPTFYTQHRRSWAFSNTLTYHHWSPIHLKNTALTPRLSLEDEYYQKAKKRSARVSLEIDTGGWSPHLDQTVYTAWRQYQTDALCLRDTEPRPSTSASYVIVTTCCL